MPSLARGVCALLAQATQPPALPHETIVYTHDGLNLEADFYKPQGSGPFALVVDNHGSAVADDEGRQWPAPYIARIFVPAGYALLVPERRGYGTSEGLPFSKAIGTDRGPRFVERQRQEAIDINAAVEYLLADPGFEIERRRIAVAGWSFGGIVTMFAAGASDAYAAVVVQAPGALNWNRSEDLQAALLAAARPIRVPLACMVARNDLTIESARQICAAAQAAGARTKLTVYPPYNGPVGRPGNPSGHALFGPAGADLWKPDAIAFLVGALPPK